MPLCEELSVEMRDETGGRETLVARMVAGYGAVRESFKSKVHLSPDDYRVDVSYLEGPFRYLKNRWAFRPVAGGCEIDFYIDYEFRSAMLGLLVGSMFDRAFRKFAAAFEDRAREIYGTCN